jgi:hypothetical protein
MLSPDLASLYGVEPRALIQAVKRNLKRFPEDFTFQLTKIEFENLKSHFVISSWGGMRRAMPYAFTEQGVAMLSSVLKSARAIEVNVSIMRAFVRIRELALSNKVILQKLDALERKYSTHDAKIETIFEAIKELMTEPKKPERRIGFRPMDTGGKAKARKKD